MTKKEKKAILEAMEQIRNNQRVIEEQIGLYDMSRGFGPRTDRMPGDLGEPGSRLLNRQIRDVDYATMPRVEDIIGTSRDPQQPSQEELPFITFGGAETLPKRTTYIVKGTNPDGSLSTQSITGTGRSVRNRPAGMRDARRMMKREQIEEDSTYFANPGNYDPYMTARTLQSRHFKPGGYDINYNPYNREADGSQGVTATRTNRNRKTDMYKDTAGNVHVGVDSESPGFTITPGLRYYSGTGRSRKEFDMTDTRKRNVDQAGASRAMATMRNIRDRLRHQNADMIGN